MKKSELINIIRNAVREELKHSLPKIVNEIISNSNTTKQTDDDPVDLVSEVLKTNRSNNVKQKTFTKNKLLNQVLNETIGGIPQEGSKVGDNQNFTDLNGQQVDIENLPIMSQTHSHDYSKLMGAVNEKKKQKMGIS